MSGSLIRIFLSGATQISIWLLQLQANKQNFEYVSMHCNAQKCWYDEKFNFFQIRTLSYCTLNFATCTNWLWSRENINTVMLLQYFLNHLKHILNSDKGACHRGGIMITYCCEKKIAGVLPTATSPAKHLFRQIEKKLEQLKIEYAELLATT